MDNLVIIGAGDFGREVYTWARQCPEYNKEWVVKGFLDDNKEALHGYTLAVGVIDTIENYQPVFGDVFVCAIGIPSLKRKCIEKILGRGGVFVNIIHPSVIFGHNINMGQGIIICPRVILTIDLKIGSYVGINLNCCLNHNVVIGDFCQLSCFCDITGHAQLGKGVFMGSHASILPRCRVGDNAVLGAGCVVTHDIPSDTTVVGIPARPVKHLVN